ncbi:MAG TPA: hypothetical protein VNU01_13240 [Egibacteraceae bacterium]|nr:hypothetical protein [Egibacteraceae bacterium]
MRRRHRCWASGLLLAVLALAVGGCRLDAAIDVDLDRDGGGTLAVELVADRALVTRAAASGTDPLRDLARRVDELAGWDAQAREGPEGGRRVRLSAGFAGPDEFDRLVAGFTAALDAPELRPLESLSLELDQGVVRVRGAAALRPGPAVSELGYTPEQAVAALADAVTYQVRLRVPGQVRDTNADRSTDGELIWTVPAGGSVDVWAEADLPGGAMVPLLVGGAAAAGAAALWLRRRAAA